MTNEQKITALLEALDCAIEYIAGIADDDSPTLLYLIEQYNQMSINN